MPCISPTASFLSKRDRERLSEVDRDQSLQTEATAICSNFSSCERIVDKKVNGDLHDQPDLQFEEEEEEEEEKEEEEEEEEK